MCKHSASSSWLATSTCLLLRFPRCSACAESVAIALRGTLGSAVHKSVTRKPQSRGQMINGWALIRAVFFTSAATLKYSHHSLCNIFIASPQSRVKRRSSMSMRPQTLQVSLGTATDQKNSMKRQQTRTSRIDCWIS